jgi:Lon protease-like protein
MTESDQTRIIPIFPLGLVQIPGGLTPLHIFEPRYRQMLADIMERDKIFGIICPEADRRAADQGGGTGDIDDFASEEANRSGHLPIGITGCLVEVAIAQQMDDGRSNILCIGGSRFRLLCEVDGEPYAQAEVELFEDDPDFGDFTNEVDRVRTLFERLLKANRQLNRQEGTEAGETTEKPADLPEDPESLAFAIISSIDLPLDRKQRWLALTNSRLRLQELTPLLEGLVVEFEERARVSRIAKTNGHNGHHRHAIKLPDGDV